ncbi:hypothetical protein EON65_40410 [archaeon]|nr:MAG: hypothetical protein EON65_40410 [archaeon]
MTIGYGSIVFGGLEAGTRVNSSYYFDAANNSWSLLPCKCDVPSPRSFHAACAFNGIMVVHGGEGPATLGDRNNGGRESGVDDPISSSLDTAFKPGADKPKYRVSQPLEGICPGDNIQPSRFGSGAPQVGELWG